MDLYTLVQQMNADGYFTRIARDPRAQFGPPQRTYLGAQLLPEREVTENAYREDAVRYRTVIANDGSRYSPAQKKSTGELIGTMLVELGHQDIARELTGQYYDALLKFLMTNASMEAIAQIIGWVETVINRALIELIEKQRWDAIVGAQVVRRGDNGFTETVTYPNPAGQRVAAGGAWSNDTYDPYDDIVGMADNFYDKGYELTRIIASRRVVSILARNQRIAARAGSVRVLSNSEIFGRVSQAELNSALQADGIPAIETYDLLYRTQTGSARFLPDNAMVFVSSTGQDQSVDWGDNQRFVPDTVGYTAIGRAVGQASPGRVIKMWPKDDKPPRLQAEGWQTSLPVLTEPESVGVISGIV
jgi:hypothetical protein